MNPKPKTLAIVGADAEFARNATDGARQNAIAAGFQIVYDKAYPPTTSDYAPVLRAVRATNPEVIFVASYSRRHHRHHARGGRNGASPRACSAAAFVGLQTAATLKQQLGPLLNGVVIGEQWVPAPAMQYPGVMDFLKTYRSRAGAEGVDPLGVFQPPFAYARMEVLEQAVKGAGTLDDDKLANYLRTHTFKTIVGDITYGKDGEWAEPGGWSGPSSRVSRATTWRSSRIRRAKRFYYPPR